MGKKVHAKELAINFNYTGKLFYVGYASPRFSDRAGTRARTEFGARLMGFYRFRFGGERVSPSKEAVMFSSFGGDALGISVF